MISFGRRVVSTVCAVTLAASMVPAIAYAESPTGGGLAKGEEVITPVEFNGAAAREIIYDVVDCLDRYDVEDAVINGDQDFIVPYANDGDEVSSKVRAAYDLICAGMEKFEAEISLEECSITVAELKDAMDLVMCNPELWWLGARYAYGSYSTSSNIDERQAASVSPEYAYTANEASALKPEIESSIEEALSWIGPKMTEFEKAQVLHDYLVRTCQYSVRVAEGGESQTSYHRAVSALSGEKVTVCQGYALAYKWLLRRAGIDAVYVSSEAMNHGWNLVRIGDSWHHVDVTWDDPLYRNPATGEVFDGGFDAKVSHTYFLKSDNSFRTMEDPHTGWTTSLQALNDYPLAAGFVYPEYKGAYKEDCSTAGHKETVIYRENEKPATCTTKGSYEAVPRCPACKEEMTGRKSVEIPALGHQQGKMTKENVVNATCTVQGSYDEVTRCLRCSEEVSRHKVKTPVSSNHSYGAWATTKAATCTAAGTQKRTCSRSGAHVETRAVAALGHNFGAWRSNGDAQVNVNGTETTRCSRCTASKTREAAGSALAPKAGQTVAIGAASYKATGAATVTYAGPANKKAASATVPATVTISGRAYKVTAIAPKAFAGNKYLKSVKIGANVKTVPASAFKGCTKLTSVSFGNGIASLGKNAFYGCKALKSVTLGTKVTAIGDGAFQNCAKLTKVTVKSTKLSKVGKNAFAGCKKLGTITLKTTKLKSVGKNAFKGTKSKMTVKVPKKKLKAYQKLCKNKGSKTVRVKK